MKKSVKTVLAVLAFAFITAMAMGTTSKAATNIGLKQTGSGTGYVELAWNAQLGVDCYHTEFSTDGKNWIQMGYSSSPTETVYSLSQGCVYYARVTMYQGGYHYNKSETYCGVSETVVVATKPNDVKNLKQTSATTNSVTMAWTPVSGATSYIIYAYINYNWVQVGTSTKATATIGGVVAGNERRYCVAAVRAVTGGSSVGYTCSGVTMRAIPAKVSRMAMTSYWNYSREASYTWTYDSNVDGYQYEVKSMNGKKTYFKGITGRYSSSVGLKPFPKGTFTKARVRAYITVGNKNLYGSWSPWTYNATNKSVTAKRSSNGKKITLKWKKISGAKGYQVYVSTKSGSGFKKVKTLSAKKTKYTITKCGKKKLKKGKTYYVQLRYYTKVGKKKVVSNVLSTATVY